MESREAAQARRAGHIIGIPLVTAGEAALTMGGTRWIRAGGRWFYQGMEAHPVYCEGRNVALVAERESGMRRETFHALWRGVVKEMLRAGAKCVRVKVVGG